MLHCNNRALFIIHPVKGVWVVFHLWLLGIALPWTVMYNFLLKHLFSIFLDTCTPRSRLTGSLPPTFDQYLKLSCPRDRFVPHMSTVSCSLSNSSPTNNDFSWHTRGVGCVCLAKDCIDRAREGLPWTPCVLDEPKSPFGPLALIFSPLLVPPAFLQSISVFSPPSAPFICMWAHAQLVQARYPHELVNVLCKQRKGHGRPYNRVAKSELSKQDPSVTGVHPPLENNERQYNTSQLIKTASGFYPRDCFSSPYLEFSFLRGPRVIKRFPSSDC